MIEKIKAVAADLQLDFTEECVALLTTEPRPVVVAGSSGGKDSDDRYAQLLAERPQQLTDSPLPPLFQTASMPIQASVA
jgi:hypothetical protein